MLFATSRAIAPASPRLCFIAMRQHIPDEQALKYRVCRAVEAGFKEIQLHYPKEYVPEAIETAIYLNKVIGGDARIIANNWIELMWAASLHGLHLGRFDFPMHHARRLAPTACIGWTIDGLGDLSSLQAQQANYIGLKIFNSPRSQPGGVAPMGMEALKQAIQLYQKPITVLGGINSHNLAEIASVLRPDDTIAMVGDICREEDPYHLAYKYRCIVDEVSR